jgi:sigma-B regulation protein RsbU (phosphoserine phosphatase)
MREPWSWRRRGVRDARSEATDQSPESAEPAPATGTWLVPPNPLRLGAGLIIAIGGPALGAWLAHLTPLQRFPAMLMSFAVFLAALVGRLLCAAIAASVSAFLMDHYWLSEKSSYLTGQKVLLALALFMLAAALASYLVVRLERSRDAERRARGELRRVLDVTDAALSLLPFNEMAREVAVRLRRALNADAAAVLLPSLDYRHLVVRAAEGVVPGQAPLRLGAGILGGVATTGLPALVGRLTAEDQVYGLEGMSSLVATPIARGGEPMGVLYASSPKPDRFDTNDLRLVGLVAVRVASAFERTRMHEQRERMRRSLEHSLIPSHLPDIPGIELAALYLPFGAGDEIGGDFYDAFALPGDAWGVAIGDVAGKGPEAAAVMGLLQHSMRVVSRYEDRPSRILAELNRILLEQDTTQERRFCTVACLRLRTDGDRARVTVSLAGHPPPVVRAASGEVRSVGEPGDLLGVFDDPVHHDVAVDIGPGDAMVLFTDGLIETREEGSQDLLASLTESLESGAPSAEALLKRIQERLIDTRKSLEDDVAVLVLRKC